MEEAMRTALRAWAGGDCDPLVRLLGFKVVRQGGRSGSRRTVGRSGSSAAVLLTPNGSSAVELARRVARRDPVRQYLFLVAAGSAARLELLVFAADGHARRLCVDDVRAPRASDLDALRELVPRAGEGGVALAMRQLHALERARIGNRFFATFRDMRARVSVAWVGLPAGRVKQRDRLALLFLCRLMFLYFLQRSGHLGGRLDYFRWLRRRHARAHAGVSFYRSMLVPLFHGVLNRRPERRSKRAARLGQVPYLNGGLFERDACERRTPRLDLPDSIVDAVFDELLDRYRFTSSEHAIDGEASADEAIDPEMLGRVFEGLMGRDERARTGTFFTPAALVDEVVTHGLAAVLSARANCPLSHAHGWLREPTGATRGFEPQLRGLRVLDPACGSGAFLLGMVGQIARIRKACGASPDVADLVAESLHGIDAQDDAALLCALRLWLTLLAHNDGDVAPLPNLDRRIRQGDALLDPLDLYSARHADRGALVQDARFRARITALAAATRAYLQAEPETKAKRAREVTATEQALATTWVDTQLARLQHITAELQATAAARDLFGQASENASAAQRQLGTAMRQRQELRRLRTRLRRQRSVPFFSFVVHFAEAMQTGFDLVVSNPPWVRAHRWPKTTATLVRERYTTCDRPGWPYATQLVGTGAGVAAQVDLAVLFLELSIRVLRPGGVIAMVLPAKLLRSLFAAGARRLLLEQTHILRIEDRSLDRRSIFNADAFVTTVVARKRGGPATMAEPVQVVLHRNSERRVEYSLPASDLPLIRGDAAAPWLLAPPGVTAILRSMQAAGTPLGAQPGILLRRGVMTGANKVMTLSHVEAKLSGLSRIRAEGSRAQDDEFCAVVESDCIRPLVRGSDIRAWHCGPSGHVLWLYDQQLRLRTPPRLLARYLALHGEQLGTQVGALFRVSAALLDTLVMWRDLAPTLEAVPMLRHARERPVPLNTVYFISTGRSQDDALLLAAYLNSLPLRVFARTIAERAKNGYFRFFAWTVAVLPLPPSWRTLHATSLLEIAGAAHARGCITAPEQHELDRLVAAGFRLGADQLDRLQHFDEWLSGRQP